MLFAKEIEPRCAYCQRGAALDEERVACIKRGVVDAGWHCRAFRYDPLKRIPPKPAALVLDKLKEVDFVL